MRELEWSKQNSAGGISRAKPACAAYCYTEGSHTRVMLFVEMRARSRSPIAVVMWILSGSLATYSGPLVTAPRAFQP
jgi:hypothetical protein